MAARSSHYPIWEGTPEGKAAMRRMDTMILEMLDPHAYYSDLSLFQSTPAAIHMLQGAHVRLSRSLCQLPVNLGAGP